jgi:hypothetical protein
MFLDPSTAFLAGLGEWTFVVEVDFTDRDTNPDGSYVVDVHRVVLLAENEAEAAQLAVDLCEHSRDMFRRLRHPDGMFLAVRVVDEWEPGSRVSA